MRFPTTGATGSTGSVLLIAWEKRPLLCHEVKGRHTRWLVAEHRISPEVAPGADRWRSRDSRTVIRRNTGENRAVRFLSVRRRRIFTALTTTLAGRWSVAFGADSAPLFLVAPLYSHGYADNSVGRDFSTPSSRACLEARGQLTVNDAPQLLGPQHHVEVPHAETGQGVHHSGDYAGGRADGPGFPEPLGTERIDLGRVTVLSSSKRGKSLARGSA